MSQRTDDKKETTLQRVIATLAANRCYACGWPLGACEPFNCSMRYKDDADSKVLAEKERWHERQREMSAALVEAMSAPSAIEPIEWQALLDALTFTAQNCGLVSDAHNSVVDKVEAMIRRSDGEAAK